MKPLHILVAPDKFKGSLSSQDVCLAVKQGLSFGQSPFTITGFPLADGGDGTSDILSHHYGGSKVDVIVHDPLLRPFRTHYHISGDSAIAFIEMSNASGLKLLQEQERNVMEATTLGTGELLLHAVKRGVKKIVLGIGGSATNDAGIGMASVFGFRFIDKDDNLLLPNGRSLLKIDRITSNHMSILHNVSVIALCDVQNTLFGRNGAAFTYATQKGASEEEVEWLDEGLRNFANIVKRDLSVDIASLPGGGAGGGIAAGVVAFLKGHLRPGIQTVFEMIGFEEQVVSSDVIITGEGKLDHQTLQGKVVAGVAALAREHQKPLIVLAGKNELSKREFHEAGIKEVFSLTDFFSEEESIKNGLHAVETVTRDHLLPYIGSL